jgi:hypothetical protein
VVVTLVALASTYAFKSGFEAQVRDAVSRLCPFGPSPAPAPHRAGKDGGGDEGLVQQEEAPWHQVKEQLCNSVPLCGHCGHC